VITRTYSVTDACLNSITVTQTITIDDDTPPTASNPAPIDVQCIGDVPLPDPAVVTDEADNCGIPVVAWVSDVSDNNTCPAVITRTYSVTDACQNSITVTQTITVDDDTPPTASNPAPIDVQCIGDVPLPDPAVVTDEADNCTAVPVVAWVSDVSDNNTCPEVITRTYSVTDDCQNSINVTQTITVDDDIDPVLYGVPADVQTACDNIPPPATTVMASDNCTAMPTISYSENSTQGMDEDACDYYTYTITRTWTATDDCNNSASASQVITVVDDIAPEFDLTTFPTTPVVVDCGTDPIPFWIPVYSDNCDLSPILHLIVDHDIVPQPDGTKWHIRTWQLEDACNNTSGLLTQTIIESRCQFSTLTQGFYGNQGGTYCANGYGTPYLLSGLLAPSLTVGISGNNDGSLTMVSADASCVIQYLPSGGTASALPSHDYVFGNNCKFVPGSFSQLNNGRFSNILLGQTITFALNLRLDPNLVTDIKLPPTNLPYLWTTEANYVNGICLDGNDVEVPLSTKGWYIPPSVITALQSMYPSATDLYLPDLLALANRGLAGFGTYGASLADITMALDAYNKGFDGARFFAGYHAAIPKRAGEEVMPEGFALHQNHPNPFNPVTTINYTVPVECHVRITVFNTLGEVVAVLADARVPAGTHHVVWESNRAHAPLATGVYTYRMQATGPDGMAFSDVKKMMLVK
jgi:hypothetical protein